MQCTPYSPVQVQRMNTGMVEMDAAAVAAGAGMSGGVDVQQTVDLGDLGMDDSMDMLMEGDFPGMLEDVGGMDLG